MMRERRVVVLMEEISEEPVQVVARVCAIDIGKAGLVACVRVPHASRLDRLVQEVREYARVTPALALADWLRVVFLPDAVGDRLYCRAGPQAEGGDAFEYVHLVPDHGEQIGPERVDFDVGSCRLPGRRRVLEYAPRELIVYLPTCAFADGQPKVSRFC